MAFRTNKTPVLQEKSASGSVATFNTALAMPLASCKIAVNAWQEGSGTPSPDNVRTINGYSDINIGATGKNLFSYDLTIRDGYWANGFVGTNAIVPKENANFWQYIRVYVEGLSSVTLSGFDAQGGTNCAWLSSENTNDIISEFNSANKNATKTVPSGAKYLCLVIYNINNNSTTYPNAQVEIGNTATDYQPFGTYTTIQIGSTVYGGEYDARTGLFTVTYKYFSFDYTTPWAHEISADGYNNFYCICPSDIKAGQNAENSSMMCSASPISAYSGAVQDRCFISYGRNFNFTWGDTLGITTAQGFKDYLQANNLIIEVVAELATPQTIQLPPCPIDTLEGVNNIFADTGDIDLTYKDLDIAKRGNFREVFRLP